MLWRERVQGRRVNRPRGEGAAGRAAKKLQGPSNWFRPPPKPEEVTSGVPPGGAKGGQGGRGGEASTPHPPGNNLTGPGTRPSSGNPLGIEAAMFVPATPNSRLRKDLQHLDDKFAQLHREPGIRMVEQGGTKLPSLLTRSDPWSGQGCGRPRCFPCLTSEDGKAGNCSKESVL